MRKKFMKVKPTLINNVLTLNWWLISGKFISKIAWSGFTDLNARALTPSKTIVIRLRFNQFWKCRFCNLLCVILVNPHCQKVKNIRQTFKFNFIFATRCVLCIFCHSKSQSYTHEFCVVGAGPPKSLPWGVNLHLHLLSATVVIRVCNEYSNIRIFELKVKFENSN